MLIFPAIDLFNGQAVRLLRGDYKAMTVYSEHPEEIALDFVSKGASHIHLVDLAGARNGSTPSFETVLKIKEASGVFCEIGGGIRSMEVVDRYLSAGLDRVILGTAAVTSPDFLHEAVAKYGEKIAVGADLRNGYVAVKGWRENTGIDAAGFFKWLCEAGVSTVICTDISKDGAMQGTNRELYRELSEKFKISIMASGGVSTMEDVRALKALGLYGAIIGKAYYTGAIDLAEAVKEAE
ncbi:MAG: 1-(5-phosphoribosyl)-5-[Lachnospiraceae bacterium]|nr:1-(5-phosphoribosyl)-5-[(5-phosphoribosylamino)methylideneamino]imidazole-4-carboxamide isomerase [Lachnospiraceae bacterium]